MPLLSEMSAEQPSPKLSHGALAHLRVAARSAGFVGLTLSLLACLEADLRKSPASQQQALIYKWMGRYGKALLRLYGLMVTTSGLRAGASGLYPGTDGRGLGRIFIMNHRSMLDIFVDLAFIEANIVSRADLSRWPVIGLAARKVGTLFVDRSSKQSSAAVITAMCSAIKQGRGVLVYPEGTTFAGDEVRPFRPGAFITAARTGAEIVPLGIAYGGLGTAYVDEPFPVHYRRVTGSPETKIGLAFGDAMSVEKDADIDALCTLAHERVATLVRRARESLGEAGLPGPHRPAG
jgi:1-acyl-sn-glycerol-3-phosphate acyltransferase